jgi:hypothetical protein
MKKVENLLLESAAPLSFLLRTASISTGTRNFQSPLNKTPLPIDMKLRILDKLVGIIKCAKEYKDC